MFKKIDSVTILLSISIFLIGLISLYIFNVDKHLQNYASYHDAISKMKVLNKEFDNFLLSKSNFINYDKINKQTLEFEKELNYLKQKPIVNKFSAEFYTYLKNISKFYDVKLNNIEYFKSQNAQLIDSIHYLFDVNDAIQKSDKIDKQSIVRINHIYLSIMKYYINTSLNSKLIQKDINYLKAQQIEKKSLEIEIFLKHASINLNRIKKYADINNQNKLNYLDIEIEKLHIYLDNNFEENNAIERTIIGFLFLVIILVLFMLTVSYKRSVKLKYELLGFKTAIENSYNSIVITDPDSNITYVNDVAQKETGYSREELMGQNPRVLKSGMNDKNFYDEMHDALNAGHKWEGEFINKRKDGTYYHEKASIMPIFRDNKLVNYLAIKLNITDYIDAKKEMQHMAYHDALTSLPNRINIENYLENRLKVADRENTKIALLFIDLDRFKNINDTLGHDVGDELLIEVSSRLQQILRKSDMLSRFGGDEFAVVIDGLDNHYSVAYICEKILNLFQEVIHTKLHQLNITLSIGVSIFPDDAQDSTTLFKFADIAMYKAKAAGKNTYKYYQKELSIDAHNRFDMEQALKYAMNNNEFHMVYQPQYLLSDKSVVGIEALVRWNSKSLGFVGPDKFIPICEDIGYILELGLFIFKQACIDFLLFQKVSSNLETISINISAVQLYQDKFIDNIMHIVNEIGIKPEFIMIEITETHIMKNIVHSMNILEKLKSIGFKISIDDFGTGHSSLSYLKRFPINELKIDKSFIDNVPEDKDDISIVKAILALSSSLEYVNVAEGIENLTQEQFLLKNNCKIGQGYYFCKPKTKDDLLVFLDS